jgi:hypothetical protein
MSTASSGIGVFELCSLKRRAHRSGGDSGMRSMTSGITRRISAYVGRPGATGSESSGEIRLSLRMGMPSAEPASAKTRSQFTMSMWSSFSTLVGAAMTKRNCSTIGNVKRIELTTIEMSWQSSNVLLPR